MVSLQSQRQRTPQATVVPACRAQLGSKWKSRTQVVKQHAAIGRTIAQDVQNLTRQLQSAQNVLVDTPWTKGFAHLASMHSMANGKTPRGKDAKIKSSTAVPTSIMASHLTGLVAGAVVGIAARILGTIGWAHWQ